MADKPIELGVSAKVRFGDSCCVPISDSNDTIYPEFHYSGEKELDLPKRGTMTIEFRVRREVETETDESGDRYECDIVVERILEVNGEKDIRPSKRDMSAEDSLDSIAQKLIALHDILEKGDK